MDSIYDQDFALINGQESNLKAAEGKYLMIVNVASACGYTSQYAQLQELHDQYKNDLVIVGFPCNDFGEQESGSEKEILEFCTVNFGVSFTLASKIKIKSEPMHPVYKWLTNACVEKNLASSVDWNFHKFMIDREGQILYSFPSSITPFDERILSRLTS